MSRRSKGPHFWWRKARRDSTGVLTHVGTWLILDGTRQHSTGLGIGATAEDKDEALNLYLAHKKDPTIGSLDPSQIECADVLTKYYLDKIAPRLRQIEATATTKERWIQIDGGTGAIESRLRTIALRSFWDGKKLSIVNGDTCREYAATRTAGAARRELEDFRAAINHHRREGLHDRIVSVVLPEKSQPKEDYLERKEAAALIRHAWRYREQQNLRATNRATRKHVARFMIVARYMGSRAGVICEASIEAKRPADRAWINLKTGMFYGLPQGRRETKKKRQRARVPTALLAHMRRWQKAGQRYVVEWNGEPILKIRKAHDACVEACQSVLGRHVSPHIWRHTVATWLMQNGADRHESAGFLAMSPDTLERVYGHHHPNHNVTVMEALRKKKAA